MYAAVDYLKVSLIFPKYFASAHAKSF